MYKKWPVIVQVICLTFILSHHVFSTTYRHRLEYRVSVMKGFILICLCYDICYGNFAVAQFTVSALSLSLLLGFLISNIIWGFLSHTCHPTSLRCFPKCRLIESIVSQSEKCDKPTGDLTAKFWEQSGPIENVASRIKIMSLREFKGAPSEVGFLEYFFQNARMLKTAMVVMANPSFTPFSKDEASSKLRRCCKNMASKSCKTFFLGSNGPEGGEFWKFQEGADFSFRDPFSPAEVSSA